MGRMQGDHMSAAGTQKEVTDQSTQLSKRVDGVHFYL